MEKSALANITEKLTQPEKNFVSDLKHLAGEARRQAYRSADQSIGGSQLAYRLAYRDTGTKWKGTCEIWQTCHTIGLPSPYRRIRQRIRTDKHKEHALFSPDVQQITNWSSNA